MGATGEPCTPPGGGAAAGGLLPEGAPADAAPARAQVVVPLLPRHVRQLSTAFLAIATGLVPWVLFLGFSLPPRYDAGHWNLLWIGFDVALVAVLAYAAWAAWFRRQVLALTAVVAGTLLLCDAWFDIVTSFGRPGEWITLLTGFGGELPLAAFFFWLYRRIVLETFAALHARLGEGTAPRRLRDAHLLLLSTPAPAEGADDGSERP